MPAERLPKDTERAGLGAGNLLEAALSRRTLQEHTANANTSDRARSKVLGHDPSGRGVAGAGLEPATYAL